MSGAHKIAERTLLFVGAFRRLARSISGAHKIAERTLLFVGAFRRLACVH
ncbi:MAG: hypothetical protein KME26_29705 [Oscillatoria princeps RMCB-10]|nr:hypothetical protein [Oscillatoria princeps RMCB-10]